MQTRPRWYKKRKGSSAPSHQKGVPQGTVSPPLPLIHIPPQYIVQTTAVNSPRHASPPAPNLVSPWQFLLGLPPLSISKLLRQLPPLGSVTGELSFLGGHCCNCARCRVSREYRWCQSLWSGNGPDDYTTAVWSAGESHIATWDGAEQRHALLCCKGSFLQVLDLLVDKYKLNLPQNALPTRYDFIVCFSAFHSYRIILRPYTRDQI